MGRNKRKSQSHRDSSDDVLEINDSNSNDDWLTNQIDAEAAKKPKRGQTKTYDESDVCILGLERIIGVLADDAADASSTEKIDSQLRLARMYHSKFYESTVQKKTGITAVQLQAQQTKMDRIDRLYNELLHALTEQKKQLFAEEAANANYVAANSTNITTHEHQVHDVRVKEVNVQKFDGDPKKWPQFKSMFEECFHNKTHYSGAVKFYHLMAHLVENSEAYNTICGIDRTDANYTGAWKTLCDAFDNERKIVNDIVLSFTDMPSVDEPSRAALIALRNTTNNLLNSLPKYGIRVDYWDPILVPLLVRKMDGESIRLWSLEREQRKIAELKPLLNFIQKRADGMDAECVVKLNNDTSVTRYQQPNNNFGNKNQFVSQKGHFRGGEPKQPPSNTSDGKYKHNPAAVIKPRGHCYHCNGPHQLYACTSFGRMNIELREERLKTLGICTKCLRKGHAMDSCKIRNCDCGAPHNKILCAKRNSVATLSITQPAQIVKEIDATLLATLSVFAFGPNGNKVKVRAVSDGGSHMNMATQRLIQRLKLNTTKLSIPLEGAGRYNIPAKTIVDFMIAPAENGSNTGEWIRAGVLISISDKLPSMKFDTSKFKHIQGLPLADTKFNEPDDIDILLSVEFMARIQIEGLRKDFSNESLPVASNSTFGWVVYGALPRELKLGNPQCFHLSVAESQDIAKNLEMLWKVDEIKERPLLTSEEQLCSKIFEETSTRSADGRYIIAMPVIPNAPKLGNSLKAAIARQLSNEKRFRKDSRLKEKYVNDIQQFIDLDHMELIPPEEIEKNVNEIYYIPHHAARNAKFRVVFDGSVKTSSGVSLNDILLNGPKLQEDLVTIIMRFRTFSIALTTDITKMYRQVLVPESQRDLLRIVWRTHESEPFKHYRNKRQTYGLKSSSYCCIGALQKCALDYKNDFPLASQAVLQSFYVDDGTLGAHFEYEAEELYQQLNAMLGNGGFPLAKWATNNARIKSLIGATANSVDLDLFNESAVLGIKWSVSDDQFKYKIHEQFSSQPPTKRFIIASVARLYDPMGWISPIVVLGKVLIQDIWRTKCEWDENVSIHIQKRWNEFRYALVDLANITIPRWLGTVPGLPTTIHGFADASLKSYGICFYIRVENGNEVKSNLVLSKTKVAPLKGMTIPRLELCAALMLAQTCRQVCDVYNVKSSNVTLWVDSSIKIHWLSKCPAGMKTFVANRIAEAQDLTNDIRWKHVRTHDNPADLASRGVLANELVNNTMWFNGPTWLCESPEKWPISEFIADPKIEEATNAESKPLQVLSIIKRNITPHIESPSHSNGGLLIDYCDSMMKLVRVTARVLRFINAVRREKRYESIIISSMEYLDAQAIWVKYHQAKWFPNELKDLKSLDKKGNAPGNLIRESPILKLTPFIDGYGIMRVGGRIKRSLMSFDVKHPIILHNDCRFTHLIALEAHSRTLHGGTQQCIQYIRQRFWSINVRKPIKKIALKCVKCFRQRKQVAEQLMGDLPSTRVISGYPFESVGIDYCGPVTMKERSGRCKKTYKAYIAVFVCMKTKAVHLDIVSDLTTSAFMACLSRLISLRGSIREMFSDNATTFHGADNELKAIFAHWSEISNSDELQQQQIKWVFITPLSPTQGGIWERAVRSAKHHLRRIIGAQTLTFEEYATVLAQVSACLNSRPIMKLDDDATSIEALTPAHLVIGRRLIGPIQYDYHEIPDNRLQRWKLIQKMSQDFWLQWQREYLHQQIERGKWRMEQSNIEVGAVVLVKMDNLPPTHWPLGLITSTFPGDDGRVRNVEVKVGHALYKRSVNKIAILPISEDMTETD